MAFISVFKSCHKTYRARRESAIAKKEQCMTNLSLPSNDFLHCIVYRKFSKSWIESFFKKAQLKKKKKEKKEVFSLFHVWVQNKSEIRA